MNDVIRLRSWNEFKRLVAELKPESVVYSIDQNAMSKTKELTCLRLILPASKAYYVFVDFPKGSNLRDTGILLHEGQNGRFIEDQDIIDFLKKEFGQNMAVFSYWTA